MVFFWIITCIYVVGLVKSEQLTTLYNYWPLNSLMKKDPNFWQMGNIYVTCIYILWGCLNQSYYLLYIAIDCPFNNWYLSSLMKKDPSFWQMGNIHVTGIYVLWVLVCTVFDVEEESLVTLVFCLCLFKITWGLFGLRFFEIDASYSL